MANNILWVPFLNPVKFVEASPTTVPQYLFKHFDDYKFSDQLADQYWLQQDRYYQKFQTSDIMYFQFESNYDPINIDLINLDGTRVATVLAQNVRSNIYEAGLYVYQAQISLAAVPPGCYYLKLTAGSPVLKTMISEPISIQVSHPSTVMIEYKNTRYHADIIFETGIQFGFRVEGGLINFQPGGKKSIYEDEKLNPTIITSKPYRVFDLEIGGSHGVPEWVADKLNWIWSCNSVNVDGKPFAIADDQALTIKSQEGTAMRGVNIKVREGVNRGSKILAAAGNTNVELVVVTQIERRLFGDTSGSGSANTISIPAIN